MNIVIIGLSYIRRLLAEKMSGIVPAGLIVSVKGIFLPLAYLMNRRITVYKIA